MRKDKAIIFKLRQEGNSYRQIQKKTGVSRATLSLWFKNIAWSNHTSIENKRRNIGASPERIKHLNMLRRLKLQYQYALTAAEAKREYESFKRQTLFWAGLMVYAGEGDKTSRHYIRLTSKDFYVHRIFIAFCKKYLQVEKGAVRHVLLLYPHLSEEECKKEWSTQLQVTGGSFYKTQIIKGKRGEGRLQYGACVSIISNTSLKKRLLTWLSLAENERFEEAVIV